jgi:hypothetical protein
MTPQMLLRGVAKFVAVVVASGLAGAGIGIALSELSGNDASNEPLLPARTTSTSPSTTAATRTTTTATTPSAATTVYRVPRVQVLSAELGSPSSTGRALVAVRARVTNRGNRPLTIKPALIAGEDEIPLAAAASDAAGALLKPIDPGASATGVLRFNLGAAVAQRLADAPSARLRVANRTVVVKLTPPEGTG